MGTRRVYLPGSHYVIDDLTGFAVRIEEAREQWNGMLTSGSHWSPRQPQDLVTGVADDMAAVPARPRGVHPSLVPSTFVVAPAAMGATTIEVADSAGFAVGATCQVMLDAGVPFYFTVTATGTGSLSFDAPGLPGSVGGYSGGPGENAVVLLSGG